MADRQRLNQDVISAQERMLRLAERDHGLTPKAIFAETGIPIPTLQSWKRDTMMPLAGFAMLCRIIPDELTSLCLEPAGKHVGTDEITDGGAHEIARDSSEFNVEYLHATDPKSESGTAISPRERARLDEIHRRLRSRRVA